MKKLLLLIVSVLALVSPSALGQIYGSPQTTKITGSAEAGYVDATLDSRTGKRELNVKATLTTDKLDLPIIEFQDYHHDPFTRLRMSQPQTLMEWDFTIDPVATNTFDVTWSQSLTGGATGTWDANKVSYKLSVGTALGDKAVLKSRRNIQYFKGKANQWYWTANFDGAKTGVRKRLGAFDENNGIFFEVNSTTLRICIRSKTSGSVVDTCVDQANWNKDKLDGSCNLSAPTFPACENNPSGITADATKQQLLTCDYSWLGSNIVRCGLVISGHVQYIHQFEFSNNITTPWSQYGQFPFRYEIENLTAQAAGSDFFVTCGNVNSEGGDIDFGPIRAVSSGQTEIALTSTYSVIAGIRLQSAYAHKALRTLGFDLLYYSGNQPIDWQIIYNPTLTAPTWANASAGIAQLLQNQPAFTGGHVLSAGHLGVGSKGEATLGKDILNEIYVGSDVAGTSDIIVMIARTKSGNADILFSGRYREFY